MSTLVASKSTGGPHGYYIVSVASWDRTAIAQNFTIDEDCEIEYVVLFMKRISTANVLTVSIYNRDNGSPFASLGYKDTVVSGWSTIASEKTITFDIPIVASAGTYSIVVTEDMDASAGWGMYSAGSGTGALQEYDGDWINTTTPPSSFWFEVWATDDVGSPPTKAKTPSPANAATEEDWSARGLSWEDGGGADTYDVYFGLSGVLLLISEGQAGTSITVPVAGIPYPEEGESGAVFYWRIDSYNSDGRTMGDQWTFDARPAKATVPSPTNTATDTVLGLTTTWTGGATATSYNVLADVGDGLASQDTALEDATWTPSPTIFDYITEYTWRVDSINVYGITTGDEWTFTTIRLTPPAVTEWYSTGGYYYRLLPQSDGSLGDPPGTGVEDTDYEVLDGYLPNFINTYRRLVAVAENKFWYEDV